MLDYSQAKVYAIINDTNSHVYLGSTCGSLQIKFSTHRKYAYNYRAVEMYNKPLHIAMREINKVNSSHFKILLVKDFPCTSAGELEKELYRIIQRAWRRDIPLYNEHLSPARRIGTYGPEGKTHREAYNESSVRLRYAQGRPHYILLRYRNGVHFNSSTFSVRKYGDAGAKQMALDMQAAEKKGI